MINTERKLTFKSVRRYICNMAQYVISKYHTIDVNIMAVSRGGLIPATMLAHELGVRQIYVIKLGSYMKYKQVALEDFTTDRIPSVSERNKPMILVDDICDSGLSLQYVKEKYKPDLTMVLVHKKKEGQPAKPDYAATTSNGGIWVKFPWERNND